MCDCKHDLQIAAHMYNLKDDLKKEIKAAQKKEEAPVTIDNTTKAEIKPNRLGVHHSSACGCRYCKPV